MGKGTHHIEPREQTHKVETEIGKLHMKLNSSLTNLDRAHHRHMIGRPVPAAR